MKCSLLVGINDDLVIQHSIKQFLICVKFQKEKKKQYLRNKLKNIYQPKTISNSSKRINIKEKKYTEVKYSCILAIKHPNQNNQAKNQRAQNKYNTLEQQILLQQMKPLFNLTPLDQQKQNSEGPNNSRVTIAVTRQINQLRTKAPDGVKVIINDTDIFDIQAELEGPVQTPYVGGQFRFKLVLPQDFPKSPPKGYFITKIFHPNVSEKGEICVNTLKKDWNHQNWSFYNIFEVIKCLLIIPFPESALNEEAGKQFMEDYDSYFKYAKLMTEVHAKPKIMNKMDAERGETAKQNEKEIPTQSQQIKMESHMINIQSIPYVQTNPSQTQQQSQIKIFKTDNLNNTSTITPMPMGINGQGQIINLGQQTQQNHQIPQTIYLQQPQQNQQMYQSGTQFNQSQTNQFNPAVSNMSINPLSKDVNKQQLINNNQFINSSSSQKNQNQENLLYQTSQNGSSFTSTGLLTGSNGSFLQEEPLCTLSKNNGYYSNTVTNVTQGAVNNLQKQIQQQFNKNNLQLNLTFNNYAVDQQSFISTNTNTNTNNGKQQNEKKKWLKRI